jgi:hypothetical protein
MAISEALAGVIPPTAAQGPSPAPRPRADADWRNSRREPFNGDLMAFLA